MVPVKEEGGEKIVPFGADRTPITQWIGGGLTSLGGWALDKTGLKDGGGVNPSRRSKFYYNKDYDTKALRRDVEFEPEDRERLLKQYNEAKEAIGNIDRILPDFSAARPNQGSSAPAMPQGGGSSVPASPSLPPPSDEEASIMRETGVDWDGKEPAIDAIMRRYEELNRQMERSSYPEYDEIQGERMKLNTLIDKHYLFTKGQGSPLNPAQSAARAPLPSITPNPPRLQVNQMENLPSRSAYSQFAGDMADNAMYAPQAAFNTDPMNLQGLAPENLPAIYGETPENTAPTLLGTEMPPASSLRPPAYPPEPTPMPPASDLRPPAYNEAPPPVGEYQAPLTAEERLRQKLDAARQGLSRVRSNIEDSVERLTGRSLPMAQPPAQPDLTMAPGVPAPSRPQVASQNIPQVPVMPPDYPVRRGADVMAPAVPKPCLLYTSDAADERSV